MKMNSIQLTDERKGQKGTHDDNNPDPLHAGRSFRHAGVRDNDRPQWALWTFFAEQHDMGAGLGGIMFDDIGPNHRQGTAIFTDTFIRNAPTGDPNPAAWRQRMQYWTAIHEMGHAFNLAHAWQKALGSPWIPLANEPEARSKQTSATTTPKGVLTKRA